MKHNYNKYKQLGIDRINKLFRYDEKTGLLYNKVNRPPRALKDKIAGSIDKQLGYRQINIDHFNYRQHIIIWMITHNGNLPEGEIDHINQIRSDNRIWNLRDVNRSINRYNSLVRGKSKYRGVCWYNPTHKWRSAMWIDGHSKYIGYFNNEIDAAKAYNNIARNVGKEEGLMNFPQLSI